MKNQQTKKGGFMFHKTARLLMVGALSVSALGLTGCSDEEVSFGAGLIIGTIIGDASNDHHHHHDRDHGPRDRPFRPRGEFQIMRGNDPGQLPRNRYQPEPEMTSQELAAHFSQKFSMNADSSSLLAENFMRINQGDLGGASDLGFDKDDMLAIANQGSPKPSSVESMKTILAINQGQADAILGSVREAAQKVAAEHQRSPIHYR